MKTKILKVDPDEDFSAATSQAAAVLEKGGLVVFPTETVYGIAANADRPETLKRLASLKQRSDDKPFTVHIGETSEISRFVPKLSVVNQLFLRKAMPGPVTFIFELDDQQQRLVREGLSQQQMQALYYQNSVGLRLPDHPVARALLNAVGVPVVAPSANLAGKQAATDAEGALADLDGQVDLVIDGGRTRYGRSSTVVRLGDLGFEIIREGVLDKGILERMFGLNVLFVCTGNTCRSPMAEGIYRNCLAKRLHCLVDGLEKKGYSVCSAGVMAGDGLAASEEAVEVCRQLGVDISRHRSRSLTIDLVNQADIIYVMSRSHYEAVLALCPQAVGRVELLDPKGSVVADPIGLPLTQYRQCVDRIADLVNRRVAEILN